MADQNTLIGTIISSVLNYETLNKLLGETPGCKETSTYAPCDGRVIHENSKLGKILKGTGKLNVPDLRGKFVRGLNILDPLNQTPTPFDNKKFGNPDENIKHPGDYQEDAIIDHTHTYNTGSWQRNGDSDDQIQYTGADLQQSFTTSLPSVHSDKFETRPRNVSVYFYIKIN